MPKSVKNSYKITPAVVFRTGLVLWLMAVITFGAAWHQSRQDNRPVPLPQTPISHGTTIKMGSAEMTLLSVSFNAGQPGFTAPSGKQYAVVTLQIKNISDTPIQVLPSTDTYAKASDGSVVYLTPANLENPFRAGELLPGEQVRGELSYVISKTDHYKLFIDAIWSGGVISFKLS